MSESLVYLSIDEQQQILNKLTSITRYAPIRERIFFSHGDKISFATLLASSLVFWRSGYRAYNLNKFNRSRLSTLIMTCLSCGNGALVHSMCVRTSLTEFYRKENMWSYGLKSLFAHQVGLGISLFTGTGLTFFCAQRIGIIPVPDNFHRRGARQVAFKYFITKIKPYTGAIAMTFVASSAVMFLVGLCEYKESRTLLARLNRKTLSLKED